MGVSAMRKLTRTQVFKNHGSLTGVSERPRLAVDPGERFLLETIGTTGHIYERLESADEPPLTIRGNPCTGPVGVARVKAGDVITCHIHSIGPGSTVHLRSQRDEAWVCAGDCHALQGEGEINGAGLEMASDIVMTVDQSPYQDLEWPLVETEDRLFAVGIDDNWTVAVKTAFRELSSLMASLRGLTFAQAYVVVSSCADVRSGAIWMMLDHEELQSPVTVTVSVDKGLFGE